MALVPSEREALEPYTSYLGGPSEALRSHVVPLAGIREELTGQRGGASTDRSAPGKARQRLILVANIVRV
jgi:hypothetical protein